ncbi:Nup85 nucleoporin-domain-containing protein [Radiomyces spectabilis]|uniref:Nup85 nucleoporin-domain-containing protein n=1 Tax=Radiomyces spectabilis TaxID=64574 RepID=UPI00221F1B30|nr:Nup85 nucleoporin-domain-containing protein [Radiomyces spectabilis]KAI8377603.1 Nup85 nucleoporin-domain-containing protein [Radiomyces spectabilis]
MSKENEPLKVTEASTAQPRSDTESALPSYASKAAKSPEQTVSHDKHQEKKQVTSDEKSHQVETDHQVETHQAEADKKEDSSESEMKKSEENSEEKLNYTQISDSTQKLDDSTMTSEMSRSFEVVGQPSSDAVKENKAAAVVASEEKTGSRDARMKSNPFEVLEETSTDAESMDNDQKTKASEPSKPADDEGDVNVNASKTNAEIPISIPSELSALSVLPTVQEDLRVPMTSSSTENRSAVDHATEQSCDDNARDQDQESSTEAPVPKDDTELPASSTATKEEENHDEAQESGQDRTLHDADASSDTGLPEMDNQKMSSEEETSLAPEPTEDVDSANTEPLKPQKNADDKRNMSAHEAGSDIKDAKKSKEAPARDSLAHVDDTVTAKSEPYVATEVDVREEPLDHSFEMVDKSSEAADNEAESDMAASSVEDQKKNDNSKAEEKADRSYELVTPSSEESPVKPHEQPRPSEAAGTTESTESQDAQTNKAEKSSSDVTPEQPSTGTEDHKEGTLPDVEPEVSAEEPSQIPSEPIIPINPDDITLSEFSASSDEESDDNESLTDQEAYEDTAGEEVDKEKHMDEINAKAPKDQEEFYRASYAIFADILKYQTAQLNSQSQKAAFTARDKSQIIRCAKDYIHLLHSYLNHTSSHASQPTEIDYLRDMVQIWDLCDILCFTQDDTISTVSVCNWLNTHWPLERRSQGDNTASIDWKLVHRHLLRLNIHEAVHLLQLGLDDYSNRLRAEIERVIGLLKAVPIIHHHQHGLPNLRVWREQVLEAYQSFLRQSDASESDANILQIYKILAGDGQTVIEVGNYFEALIGILFYNLQFYSYGFADLAAVAAQLPFHEQDRVLRVCSSLLQNDWDTALASYDDYWFQAHFGHLLVALGFVSDVDQQVDVTGPIAFVMAAHAQYIGKTYQMWFEAVDYICASGASEGGAWMENLLEDTRKVQDMSFLQKVLAKCEHFKADSAQRYIHKAMARIYEKEGDLRSGAKHYAQAEDTAALDMMADKFMNEFVMRGMYYISVLLIIKQRDLMTK